MSHSGRYCRKSLFALLMINSPSRRRGDLINVWGRHQKAMSSPVTSVIGLAAYRRTIVACFVFRREISRKAVWDFFGQHPSNRTSYLGAARPLPPSADIGPGGQSVGQAAQFCLAVEWWTDANPYRRPSVIWRIVTLISLSSSPVCGSAGFPKPGRAAYRRPETRAASDVLFWRCPPMSGCPTRCGHAPKNANLLVLYHLARGCPSFSLSSGRQPGGS